MLFKKAWTTIYCKEYEGGQWSLFYPSCYSLSGHKKPSAFPHETTSWVVVQSLYAALQQAGLCITDYHQNWQGHNKISRRKKTLMWCVFLYCRSDAQRAAKQKEAKERELEQVAFSADRIEEGGFPLSMVREQQLISMWTIIFLDNICMLGGAGIFIALAL